MSKKTPPDSTEIKGYDSMGITHEQAIDTIISLIRNNKELCQFARNVQHEEVLFLQTGKVANAYIINKPDFLIELEGEQLETATKILTHDKDFLSVYHMEGTFEPLIFNVSRATFAAKGEV